MRIKEASKHATETVRNSNKTSFIKNVNTEKTNK